MYRSRKPEYAQAYRGFESHPLRQKIKTPQLRGVFIFCGVGCVDEPTGPTIKGPVDLLLDTGSFLDPAVPSHWLRPLRLNSPNQVSLHRNKPRCGVLSHPLCQNTPITTRIINSSSISRRRKPRPVHHQTVSVLVELGRGKSAWCLLRQQCRPLFR